MEAVSHFYRCLPNEEIHIRIFYCQFCSRRGEQILLNPSFKLTNTMCLHCAFKRARYGPIDHINVKWSSVNGEVSLNCLLKHCEASECLIMHEKTSSVSFEDMPCKWQGVYDTLILPCGHVFHPSAIALHFITSGMRCPVCRAGGADTLDLSCVANRERQMLIKKSIAMQEDSDSVAESIVFEYGEENDETALSIRSIIELDRVIVATHECRLLASTDEVFSTHRSFSRKTGSSLKAATCDTHTVYFEISHPMLPFPVHTTRMPCSRVLDQVSSLTLMSDVCPHTLGVVCLNRNRNERVFNVEVLLERDTLSTLSAAYISAVLALSADEQE